MIVNVQSDCIEIITHYAHGLQAGEIAMNLKKEYQCPHWVETITAIIEHDDKQINFEKNNNLTDLGLPADYRVVESDPRDVLERCKRVMIHCKSRSGWIAILVAMHLEFIYADLKDSNQEARKFFDDLHQLQIDLRKVYSVNATQCADYYQILRFCDRLSLIISQDDVPSGGRKLEINKSIAGIPYFVSKKEDRIIVEPWPFAHDFTLTTEVYLIKKIKFESSDQLQDCLLNEMPVLKTWQIAKR
ncbi:DUF3891 family protein [Nonlabens antarcticus]|uniref:DUF3891 family protein n=1 Tax=Nonlabens antarcticus TaxID=392714 RepID=UPI001891D3A2|nr:DUF3891 family protein [Nonlabens antarcticus]